MIGSAERAFPVQRPSKGLATLWLILLLPVALITLCVVVEVANLWMARLELENALESAALAAAKRWGDVGGVGDTLFSRKMGVELAAANTLGGNAVVISTNYSPANKNQNDVCQGNLVFGALIDNGSQIIFDAGASPAAGLGGAVLFDATGDKKLEPDDSWGIAFQREATTPPGLLIERIVIDLQAAGGGGEFDFKKNKNPVLSNNVSPHAVRDLLGVEQRDVVGFSDPVGQIQFTPTQTSSATLTINFFADPVGRDSGFAPGDRFRFGAGVKGLGAGNDGDSVGAVAVEATIFFTLNGSPLPPVKATFADTTEIGCVPATLVNGSLVVHVSGIPNLPCAPSTKPGTNRQSYVLSRSFDTLAVHAQAEVTVPAVCTNMAELILGSFTVSAQSTAYYDSAANRAKLVRIDQYICPGP